MTQVHKNGINICMNANENARKSEHGMIIGNRSLQENLYRHVSGQRGGFLLLTGPEHVGKKTLAELLAQTAHCMNPTQNPLLCDCASCKRFRAGIHPDHYTLESIGSVTIEHIRKLQSFTALQSAYGKMKTLVLSNAERLTIEAQNALLKFLEDHHERMLILFTSTEPHRLLPTVRSRARVFTMRRVSSETLSRELQARYPDMALSLREDITKNAYGLPGSAIAWCEDPESFRAWRERADELRAVLTNPPKGFAYAQQLFRGKMFLEQRELLFGIMNDYASQLQVDIERAVATNATRELHRHKNVYAALTQILRSRQEMLSPTIMMDQFILTNAL